MDPENRFTPNEREKAPLRPLKFDDHSLGDLDSVTQINNIDESKTKVSPLKRHDMEPQTRNAANMSRDYVTTESGKGTNPAPRENKPKDRSTVPRM